jgi:SAM-dependent methyltransferase
MEKDGSIATAGAKKLIDTGLVNFGKQSWYYAKCRPGYPDSFYQRLNQIRKLEGSVCLDVGCGPGTVALELLRYGATEVVGVDISPEQIDMARSELNERFAPDQAKHCTFHVGSVENMPVPDNHFDIVIASQCWHWFDPVKSYAEAKRVLKPNGLLIVCMYCYLCNRSPIAKDCEDIIFKHNEKYRPFAYFDGINSKLIDQAIQNGMDFAECFCYDHEREFTRENWIGRLRTCNGVGSNSLGEDMTDKIVTEIEQVLKEKYPETFNVYHRIWTVISTKKE